MPIKRLIQQPSMPTIGKLRKGGEKQSNGQFGKELDYWRFTTTDPSAQEMFTEAYGEQPRKLLVYLPHSTMDENFDMWMEKWVSGGLEHRCDGENTVMVRKGDGYSNRPEDQTPCPGGCTEVGRLAVVLPVLKRLALVTMETHAINDIVKIQRSLSDAEMRFGSLQSIPFELARVLESVSTPSGKNDGKRIRRDKWMVRMEVDPTWASLQLAAHQARSLEMVTAPPSRQLTTDLDFDMDDIEEVEWGDDDGMVETVVGDAMDGAETAELFEISEIAARGRKKALPEPPPSAEYIEMRSKGIRWGMEQDVFNLEQHAENSFKKLEREYPDAGVEDMAKLWAAKVRGKVAEKKEAEAKEQAADAKLTKKAAAKKPAAKKPVAEQGG